jgi:hypothetical protein
MVVDSQGVPLGGSIASAAPVEVKLAEGTRETVKVPRRARGRPRSRPKRLIVDKAYDSDKLQASLEKKRIRLLFPYRRNRMGKNMARSRGALSASLENRTDYCLTG